MPVPGRDFHHHQRETPLCSSVSQVGEAPETVSGPVASSQETILGFNLDRWWVGQPPGGETSANPFSITPCTPRKSSCWSLPRKRGDNTLHTACAGCRGLDSFSQAAHLLEKCPNLSFGLRPHW